MAGTSDNNSLKLISGVLSFKSISMAPLSSKASHPSRFNTIALRLNEFSFKVNLLFFKSAETVNFASALACFRYETPPMAR